MRCFFQRASRDKGSGVVTRKDLKDPHAAAMSDFVAAFEEPVGSGKLSIDNSQFIILKSWALRTIHSQKMTNEK
jgi:hypothetical protein